MSTKDVNNLTEDEIEMIIAARERAILHEETSRFIDENRAEIVRRAQARIEADRKERERAHE